MLYPTTLMTIHSEANLQDWWGGFTDGLHFSIEQQVFNNTFNAWCWLVSIKTGITRPCRIHKYGGLLAFLAGPFWIQCIHASKINHCVHNFES
jgi:hypothetical protein